MGGIVRDGCRIRHPSLVPLRVCESDVLRGCRGHRRRWLWGPGNGRAVSYRQSPLLEQFEEAFGRGRGSSSDSPGRSGCPSGGSPEAACGRGAFPQRWWPGR
jgi:hypothetical protein